MGKLANIPGANLVPKINAAHRAAFGKAKEAMESAAECGRLLLEAKDLVPHGEWVAWLEANTETDERQSQKYMRLAKHWPEIEKRTCGSYLGGINDALKLIAKPKPSRKPKPGDVLVIHHDEDDGPEEGEAVMRFRGLAGCCDQGWNSADDALAHVKWLLKNSTIDHATLEAVEAAFQAWGEVYTALEEKRGATLPQDGRSEGAVDHPTPSESSALFSKLETELKKRGTR